MTTMTAGPTVGDLLRSWRQRRRLSQLDLSLGAEVSARHLSFVETGRSKPSRELVLHLAEHLDVPLRERNALLLAAGYAPAYRQRGLDDDELAPVHAAVEQLLRAHEPYPAVVVDRHWDLVRANQPALAILADGVAPALLAPPVNTLRVTLHPDGLAPRIANLAEYGAHLLARLEREVTATGDAVLSALVEELRSYPGVVDGDDTADPSALFVPLELLTARGELRLFSTIATFGTALDVTVSELAIESFFPADTATRELLAA